MAIINPDYYYSNPVDTEYFKNPLLHGQWHTDIDDPLFEIAGLSFYSLPWAAKYILNTELAPFQCVFLQFLWQCKYPLLLASRGASKTFTLAIYCILRALFDQGSKVVVVSSTFRQAKHVYEEVVKVYQRAPLLRACTNSRPHKSVDYCEFVIGESRIKFLPMGNGDNIRGERASHVIVDEVDSVNPEIMHIVVRGFAATHLDPISKIKAAARRKLEGRKKVRKLGEGNQIVIAGTAGFTGGNFHQLYAQYEKIILSKARGYGYDLVHELGADYGDTYVDYRDYGIIKLPWRYVPEGLLDRDMIASARMTMSSMLFDMEYECRFADASHGFFKPEVIRRATAVEAEAFTTKVAGEPKKKYVLGVDPARTSDAFAIAVLELDGNVKKFVYCWTYINQPFSVGVKKIRQLLRKFNVVQIGMDAGGGGLAVRDLLQAPEMIPVGEEPILEVDTDGVQRPGQRILRLINFEPKWIEDANFMLQKNIEDRDLLFPNVSLGGKVSAETEILEEVYDEIEECKREMAQISVTQTVTGKRHFDIAPSLEDKKRKVKPRKDRYSALLIANAIARDLAEHKNTNAMIKRLYQKRKCYGGWVEDFQSY